jgi:hypothetical protein
MFDQPPLTAKEVFGRGFVQGLALLFWDASANPNLHASIAFAALLGQRRFAVDKPPFRAASFWYHRLRCAVIREGGAHGRLPCRSACILCALSCNDGSNVDDQGKLAPLT